MEDVLVSGAQSTEPEEVEESNSKKSLTEAKTGKESQESLKERSLSKCFVLCICILYKTHDRETVFTCPHTFKASDMPARNIYIHNLDINTTAPHP